LNDRDVAPPRIGPGGGVLGLPQGDGRPDGVISIFADNSARMLATLRPPPVHTKPIIVSYMSEGLLIRKVTPAYPQIAMVARQQGTVLLHAIIGRDGTIQQLQAVSGPPLLIKAAMDAVAQWRYRPYVLNGQPVEVDTQITVNFKLGG
jgi:protein TonB